MEVLTKAEKKISTAAETSLISNLLLKLDEQDINYCHWKSNWRIADWLDGDGDLDLLVRRQDIGKFTALLIRMGFKKALVPPESEMPGIINFYGLCQMTQKFVHVHAHYQLTIGHDFTKNFRLPVEKALLETTVRRGKIYTAAPAMELILFVVRMVLKYSVIENAARTFSGKAEKHWQAISNELEFLEAHTNEFSNIDCLIRNFPMIDGRLFKRCRQSLRKDAGIWERTQTKRALQKSLAAYSRRSASVDALTKFGRAAQTLSKKIFRIKPARKKLENGGAIIAIVGGDGAGKTTCVNEIYRWLSKKIETRRVHIGKPPKSLLTIAVGAALKLRNAFLKKASDADLAKTADQEINYLQCLRWLCTGRDRYRLYKKIRRLAANGTIVICDRYPVPNLNMMDSPKISRCEESLYRIRHLPLLGNFENWYYKQILPPDLMFVLRVEPYTAVSRKTDEAKTHVFSRSRELWNFEWQEKQAQLLDAGRPLEQVLTDLRYAIWRAL